MTDLEIAKLGNVVFMTCDRIMTFIKEEDRKYVVDLVEDIKHAALTLEKQAFKED